MKIKKGDYFDLYQDGAETKRVVAVSNSFNNGYVKNFCHVIDIRDLTQIGTIEKLYFVDIDNEVENVIGNIFE